MSLLLQTLEKLAGYGCHLDLSNHKYLPVTLEKLVAITAKSGGHITINASDCLPPTLENLAKIGGNHVTLRF